MKKSLPLLFIFTSLGFCCLPTWADTTTNPSTSNQIQASPAPNNAEKIQKFLASEKEHLSKVFPYRINLPENGQIAQNKAGIRIAENAQQLFSNNTGQLFYYDLYDHAMRVPHWHANATEVGVVLNGKMRITIWDGTGNVKVFTVEKNGTWTIPDAILEQSVGLTPQEIVAIKKTTKNRLSKYDPSAAPVTENIASPFSNNFSSVQPLYSSPLGSVKRIDANNTPAMQAMAIQQTILKPGSMREPHWYTGADDFFYVCKGTAFFTMMADDGKVYNVILKPGDLVFIPVGTFHTYVNVGKDDLEVYETFDGSKNINEITLLSGAQHFSAETLAGAIGISKESAQKVIARPSQAYYCFLK
jgi:oxalate decarboxylase